MRYVRDTTGRFSARPYFEPGELDELCQQTIEKFLIAKYGEVFYPIPTDGLELLLEQHEVILDCYADLTAYGDDTDGATIFEPGRLTRVYVSTSLSTEAKRENRFRTTLAHEFGHVLLHGPLYTAAPTGDLFESRGVSKGAACTRRSIETVPRTDWLEWQAGFVSGALLMPFTPLREAANSYLDAGAPEPIDSPRGKALVEHVFRTFQVSREAAEVRLQQTGLLAPRGASRLL